MKCLPASNSTTAAQGLVLHDWHAEIVAIRAFNRFLLEEAYMLASSPELESAVLRRQAHSEFSQTSGHHPFTVHEGIRIMMYCSEAPCGDASMELVMEAQEDATPWPLDSHGESLTCPLLGRGSFSQLGVVRRKPEARADSPPTHSKSCSDKLALKQCMSLLSSTVSLLVSPANAYIHTLILPRSQHRAIACERSFGSKGRMEAVAQSTWSEGYSFHPFSVKTTEVDFSYSRGKAAKGSKGSNIAAVWTPHIQETLINGVLQGRKQTDPKGASSISTTRLWNEFLHVKVILDEGEKLKRTPLGSYGDLKGADILQIRREVKSKVTEVALKGWCQRPDDT